MKCEVTDFGALKMGIFPHSEVGGAIVAGEWYKPSPDGSLLHLEAGPDLTTVLEKVVAAGGQVLQEKK